MLNYYFLFLLNHGWTFRISFLTPVPSQLNHYLVITRKASGLGTKVWWLAKAAFKMVQVSLSLLPPSQLSAAPLNQGEHTKRQSVLDVNKTYREFLLWEEKGSAVMWAVPVGVRLGVQVSPILFTHNVGAEKCRNRTGGPHILPFPHPYLLSPDLLLSINVWLQFLTHETSGDYERWLILRQTIH